MHKPIDTMPLTIGMLGDLVKNKMIRMTSIGPTRNGVHLRTGYQTEAGGDSHFVSILPVPAASVVPPQERVTPATAAATVIFRGRTFRRVYTNAELDAMSNLDWQKVTEAVDEGYVRILD